MNKKKLSQLRTMTATPKMMQMAKEDVPNVKTSTYWNTSHKEVRYKYGLYMRCKIQSGILTVAFYLSESMRMGANLPAYELYIDIEKRQFLTYDHNHEKWLTAKLDMIDWPKYVYYSGDRWISSGGVKTINKNLGCQNGGYRGLLNFQLKVRAEELERRHKRETDPWDLDLKQTPALPKDWGRWITKVGIQENYIFYQYTRDGATSGYCSYCEKNVPIRKPRHNKLGTCSCCRHKITYKSVGKAGTVITKKAYQYLIQRCEDGFMVRQFEAYRKHWKSEYAEPEVYWHEIRRALFDHNANGLRAYYWGDYKQRETRWIRGSVCTISWYGYDSGRVYGKTLPDLEKKELSRTGLVDAIHSLQGLDPEYYLAIWKKVPQIEQLAKADLPFLVKECLDSYYNFRECFKNKDSSSLKRLLGIDSQELERLRKNKGGRPFLEWLQYEKVSGKILQDEVISWLCNENIDVDDLKFIRNRMNIVQIYNYIRRQMKESRMKSREVLTTWEDYLSMAERFQMDTSDAIIYRVKLLRQRHDELVERCHQKAMGIRAGEILKKYPHVEQIYKEVKSMYEYADEEYSVVAPECIEDVILEGENLHHCADSSERYWERAERRESYVLFLRHTNDISKSYYTLEIEPDGTIRQKRTMYDRQEADIEDARKFLMKWQKEIASRITERELELAKTSRDLREREFLQLKRDRVIIPVGYLAGKQLVDVLKADLMVNEELASALALPKSA